MTPMSERRCWQVAAWIACLVPLSMGTLSVVRGVVVLKGAPRPPPADLDSHFRYLSGIFLALGVAFVWSIAGIDRRAATFRLLGLMVVSGGLARVVSLIAVGPPGLGGKFGLIMELGVVPVLMLWQARVARRNVGGWQAR